LSLTVYGIDIVRLLKIRGTKFSEGLEKRHGRTMNFEIGDV